MYGPRVNHTTLNPKVMQRYNDARECKLMVRKWAILNGYNIRWVKRTSRQLNARCQEGCKWRLYGSMLTHEKTLVIKTPTIVHTCYRVQHNRQVFAWLNKSC